MQISTENRETCGIADISAYVDGELEPAHELRLEAHLDECGRCRAEVELQKRVSCSIRASLSGDIVLPDEFTKRLIVTAESSVSGIRRSRADRLWVACAIIISVFLAVVFVRDLEGGLAAVGHGLDQAATVLGFAGRLIYSFLVGLGAVMRPIGSHLQVPAAGCVLLLVICAYFLRTAPPRVNS